MVLCTVFGSLVPVLLPLIQPLAQVTQLVGAMVYSSIQLHGGGKEGEHIGGWLDLKSYFLFTTARVKYKTETYFHIKTYLRIAKYNHGQYI